MSHSSLKNLDSFSRGYIEDVRSNVDFDTTLRALTGNAIENSLIIQLTGPPVNIVDGSPYSELENSIIGKVISGKGISGVPRVTGISADGLIITIDQAQTLGTANLLVDPDAEVSTTQTSTDIIALTFSDANSGIDQYELTGSAISRSKENIRIEDLVPEELLDYATNSAYGGNQTGGIREFLESYYKFMNLEEFTYKALDVFEDVVIDNQAIFRINVPNKFFQRNLVIGAKFFDADGIPLLVGDEDGSPSQSGDALLLDDTARLTVGKSYQITDLGNGTIANIATGLNNISGQERTEYDINDVFTATNDGTGYDATQGSSPVSVRLLVYPETVDDIFTGNISLSNANELPGRLGESAEPTGRTVNIYNLSPRLNKRKMRMEVYVLNYVNSGPSYRLNTIEDSLNLQEAQEEFLDYMQKEIAPSLDKTSPVDKRAVYEKIIDFYKIRGSFESIETFFKLLYNEQEVQVSYPWDNTLKPSDGKYDPRSAIAANYKFSEIVESSDNANNDLFGKSVSISGKSIAVGAPNEDSNGTDSGAVYVFTTADNGKTWAQEAKIVSTTTDADVNFVGDHFGRCVSLNGNTLAIGAPEDETTHGVAGTGSVEIWDRSVDINGNNIWRFTTKIIPGASDGINFAAGNESISLDKDYLAISHVDYAASGPRGAVVLYKRTGSTWNKLQTITAPNVLNSGASQNHGFGETVVVRGKYLVTSFQNYSTPSIAKTGRAVVYLKNEITGQYELDNILSPSNDIANQTFGYAIDITNVENGTPRIALTSRDNPYHTVYIFERSENAVGISSWVAINSLPSYVIPSIRDNTTYGIIVRISGDNLIIGEQGFDDGVITDNGKIYHYEFNTDTEVWQQKEQYRGDTTVVNHNYGFAIDISHDEYNYLAVGAPGKIDGTGNQKGFLRTYDRPAFAGNYTTAAGFLSEKSIKVHDSDFYQKFSYVVKVARNLSQWKEPFDKLVHPAGFKYFGEVLMVIQAVRAILGDDNPDTTVGIGTDTQVYENAYSASPAFRRTFSSMPGVQPGYIGIEDIGLLIQAIASTFGIIGIARTNRDAKLAMKSVTQNGGLIDISIAEAGHGYPSVPAITLSGAGSGATATATINSKGEVDRVIIAGGHNSFNIGGIATDSGRVPGTYTSVTTGGSRSSGSGASGVVTIVVDSNEDIHSVTSTTAGSNYEIGEIITIPGSAVGGGDSFTFTVASVGTGYTIGGTLVGIQTLAQENADDGLTGDNEIVASKIGKLNSTSLGLDLVGLNKKEYVTTPLVTISAPDALGADGKPLTTNVQATATLTRDVTTKRITGFTITNPGFGYLNDATIKVESHTAKRAPDYMHKKIIPANHDVEIQATLSENSYFERKNYIPITEYNVRVASKSGDAVGNAFWLNNVEAPVLTLTRGATYRFLLDHPSNSNNAHPFEFSRGPDGIHANGLAYAVNITAVGLPGTDGAYIEFKVSENAPNLLYYYCSNHTGMGNTLNIFGKNMAKENPAFLGQKKFQGNYQIHNFDEITIEDIYNSTADGTSINNINAQASLSNAITNKTL